ncbi:tetratricopeptide repeat protein [Brevundimonas sp. A19_0]|uniref:tetratricopeptide repeat protein n=1 Tax=Brevundimonas sp. A19_0 TaxID=2821087 RepID=UPI001ADC8848|nr:tetratricopeptide repeat protein [Brevundimonas sp. A19_0]MBO9500466.1 tetratricopeptide repeat protein [Brevundimonas sp. A19_0]
MKVWFLLSLLAGLCGLPATGLAQTAGPDGAETRAALEAEARMVESVRVEEGPEAALARAEPALARARAELGEDHPVTLHLMANSAFALGELGRPEEALARLDHVASRWAALGWDRTAFSQATDLYRAGLLAELDRNAAAEALLTTLLGQPDLSSELRLRALTQMADVLYRQSRFEDGLAVAAEALTAARTLYGDRHDQTLEALGLYGTGLDLTGDDRALPILRQAVEGNVTLHGAADRRSTTTLYRLASARMAAGRPDLAEPLLRQLFMGEPDLALRAIYGHRLALALMALDRPGEAEAILSAAVEMKRQGGQSLSAASSLSMQASALDRLGRHREAEPLHREALALLTASGAGWEAESSAWLALGDNQRALGHPLAAIQAFARARDLATDRLPDGHPRRLMRDQRLAAAWLDSGQSDAALALARQTADAAVHRLRDARANGDLDPWDTRRAVFGTLVRAAWDTGADLPSQSR